MINNIKGGKADNKKPSNFRPSELAKGIKIEHEHTSNKNIAKEIAMDHLTEFPNYYTELDKMEERLKKQKKSSIKDFIQTSIRKYVKIERELF